MKNKTDPQFGKAIVKEVGKLIKLGIYEIFHESEVSSQETILQLRFVFNIKNFKEDTEYFKARLVIPGHLDPEKPRVVNEAPAVLKSSIRLLLALISSCEFPLWSRDITLAFLQSKDKLKRNVYVRPPKDEKVLEQIGAPYGSVLKALKLQDGLAEYPGYLWQTFRDWHVTDLDMKVTAIDPCFFCKIGQNVIDGLQVTRVDDTCGGGSSDFSILESDKSKIFNSKPR